MMWHWNPAVGIDITELSAQGHKLFEVENPTSGPGAQKIFAVDPLVYSHRITLAVINQFYNPGLEMVYAARDTNTNQLLAHTWVARGVTPLWSNDEMAEIKMAHVDYDLPTKTKLKLIREMMDLWEVWCNKYGIQIIHSSTMRQQTQAFLKMHQRCGYDVRGSSAYKRLEMI